MVQRESDSRLSLYQRIQRGREQHRAKVLATLAVLATLGVLASELFPEVETFISSRNIVGYLTLILVVDLLANETQKEEKAPLIRHFDNQDQILPILTSYIPPCRQETIDLIEYAGMTTLPLIREIQRQGVTLRLLVQHPEKVAGIQKQRQIATLDTLYDSIFERGRPGAYEIRCYRKSYNLRARRFGRHCLELGWLTHDTKRSTAFGHANPSFIVDVSQPGGEVFMTFFQRTFDDLWNDADSEDGRAVLDRLKTGESSS